MTGPTWRIVAHTNGAVLWALFLDGYTHIRHGGAR